MGAGHQTLQLVSVPRKPIIIHIISSELGKLVTIS